MRYIDLLNKKCKLWNKVGKVEQHFLGNKAYYLFRFENDNAVELNQLRLSQIIVL